MIQQTMPDQVILEDLAITNYPNQKSFFEHFFALALQQKQLPPEKRNAAVSLTYNVFSANLAAKTPHFKTYLQKANILRCDGIGALLGSRIVGTPIKARLTNANYFIEQLEKLAEKNLTVFLLGGKPGVAEKALQKIETLTNNHSVVGVHHGYITKDESLNQQAINAINRVNPDVVIVGMGMPVQEEWIFNNKDKTSACLFFAVGALIDYFGDAQYRCPVIYQKLGLEWLTRLVRYPKRLFGRYVIGNPYYLGRMVNLSFNRQTALIKRALQPAAKA